MTGHPKTQIKNPHAPKPPAQPLVGVVMGLNATPSSFLSFFQDPCIPHSCYADTVLNTNSDMPHGYPHQLGMSPCRPRSNPCDIPLHSFIRGLNTGSVSSCTVLQNLTWKRVNTKSMFFERMKNRKDMSCNNVIRT